MSAATQASLPCARRACDSASSPDSLPLSAQTVHPAIEVTAVGVTARPVLDQTNGGAAALEEQVTGQTSLYERCNARHVPPRGV